MIPYIEDTKSPRQQLRIKHKLRLTVFLLLIVCTLLTILIPKKRTSNMSKGGERWIYKGVFWRRQCVYTLKMATGEGT